jgi:hypothetical protein
VIKQALADAGVGMESGQRIGVNAADRAAARSFLTANTGSWKQARDFWASMADLDPYKLRSGAMRVLGIEASEEVAERPADCGPLKLFHPVPKPTKPPRAPTRERLRYIAERSRPQEGQSKRQQVLALLMRPEGVSLDEICERFGWKRTTAQTSINYDLKNYGVRGVRCHDGRYRAVATLDSGNAAPPAPRIMPQHEQVGPVSN